MKIYLQKIIIIIHIIIKILKKINLFKIPNLDINDRFILKKRRY